MADDEKLPDPPAPEPDPGVPPEPGAVKCAQLAMPLPPQGQWLWMIGILEPDGRFRYAACPIMPVRSVCSAGFRHDVLDPGLHALQQQLGPGPLITLN